MFLTVLYTSVVLLVMTGLCYIVMKRKSNALIVLVYQKIGDPPKRCSNPREWTSVVALTALLDQLQKHAFSTLSVEQIRQGNLPSKSVFLVFLDGYRSFYQKVYPLLEARRMHACVCIPTAAIGTYNQWQNPHQEPWQDLLTRQEVEELSKNPLICIGAQALQREDITQLSPQQASYTIQESLWRLSQIISRQPEVLAIYPARQYSKNTTELLSHFQGLILTPKIGLNFPPLQHLKICRGNSIFTKWILWRMW
ncbi:MAG: polysaccharide deacetylase family protein [Elusimicrobiaceae bacterium]|nr:polysaccharide deacetylase family protein [Elusimicrobiaceae bacterium]